MNFSILELWIYFGISNIILGSSVMMLAKGTLPPPMQNKKANPVFSTALFTIGMTGLLVFGTPELLQQTLEVLTK